MAGKLITLPLRVSLRSAQLLTRATVEVAGRTLSIAEYAIGVVAPGRFDRASPNGTPAPQHHHDEPAEAPRVARRPPTATRRAPTPTPTQPTATAARPAPPAARPAPLAEPPAPLAEPTHISEEPELVETSAEPGAEDGAGATITVQEPWAGYGQMKARDVIDRARLASVAELAAIELYEARHRARQTVLAAVERQLKLADVARPA
jgi:hypothetical protein